MPKLANQESILYQTLTESLTDLPIIPLYQKDFANGTYRIQSSGIYRLMEDIVFDPNPDNDYKPYPNDPKYCTPPQLAGTTFSKPFSLGFFAAITIETHHVMIDLNGHSMSQSKAHALQQRFYAHIDLTNTPFLPNQGPGDFGNIVIPGKYCVIRNGTLLLSSHHGIHGNNASYIILEDLVIKDFEVAAIQISGGSNIILRNIKIGPNRQDIPVMATYSAGRFLLQFVDALLKVYPDQLLQNKRDQLANEMNVVFQEVMTTGKTTHPVFENPSGLLDGLVYGVLIHPPGVAINDFINSKFTGPFSENVFLNKICIQNLKCRVDEVVGISGPNGTGMQIDPSNSVFKILSVTDSNGFYKGNALTDLQIAYAQKCLSVPLPQGMSGKLTITSDLVEWATSNLNIQDIFKRKNYKYKCSADSMLHLTKGCIGYRLDGVKSFFLRKCSLSYLVNYGYLGSDICGQYLLSHDKQERPGYHGADTTGINLSNCSNGEFFDIKLTNLHSHNGETRGIRFINGCHHLVFNNVHIENLKAGHCLENGIWKGQNSYGKLVPYTNRLPNIIPNAIGIKVEDPTYHLKVKQAHIKHLQAPGLHTKVFGTEGL